MAFHDVEQKTTKTNPFFSDKGIIDHLKVINYSFDKMSFLILTLSLRLRKNTLKFRRGFKKIEASLENFQKMLRQNKISTQKLIFQQNNIYPKIFGNNENFGYK